MMFAGAIWIPLAPVVLIVFACWLLRRLAQGETSEVRALPEQTVLVSSRHTCVQITSACTHKINAQFATPIFCFLLWFITDMEWEAGDGPLRRHL